MRPGGKRPIDQSDQCPPIPPSSSAQHGLASLANVGDGCAEEEFFGYSNISSDSLFKSEHKIYGGGPVRGIPHNSQRPSRERRVPSPVGTGRAWRMRGGAVRGGFTISRMILALLYCVSTPRAAIPPQEPRPARSAQPEASLVMAEKKPPAKLVLQHQL